MNIINTLISVYGTQILGAILTAIAGVLAVAVKQLATKYINTEIKQNLAKTAVKAVEQVYKDIHGEEKLAKAMEYLSTALKEYNIEISTAEMKLLLEAAVGEFNKVFEKKAGEDKLAKAE